MKYSDMRQAGYLIVPTFNMPVRVKRLKAVPEINVVNKLVE